MNLSLTFSPYWYMLFFAFLAGWFTIMMMRRRKTSTIELKGQVVFGTFCLLVAIAMELFAVSSNLWNYSPSNWPLMLWPTYFVAALFGYQLMRTVGEKFSTFPSRK